MLSLGSRLLSVAIFLFIGVGISVKHVEAACSTVVNCLDCVSPNTGVCTNCSTLYGLDYKSPTSTVCTACKTGTNNCQLCTNVANCTRCTNTQMGPDYGLGSCSPCSAHCSRCTTAGGGKCDTCASGYLVNANTLLCEGCGLNCSSCVVSGPGSCDICVDGYGLHTDTKICDPCMTGCAKCARNITECTQCTSTTQVPEKNGSGTCGDCADNCDNCTLSGPGQCDLCTSPYMLFNDSTGTTSCKSNLTASCQIVPRSEWTSRALPTKVASRTGPYDTVIFHMTFTNPCTNDVACVKQINALENYQIKYVSQSCIVYNFVIGENGQIYEGRGADKVGNATKGYDYNAINVAVVGTFTARAPIAKAMDAIGRLLGPDCRTYLNIASIFKYYNHYDVACTRCPGKNFRAALKVIFPDNHGGDKGMCLKKRKRNFPRPMK